MITIWKAGGDWCGGRIVPYVYGFGFWSGEQQDLLCVKKCNSNKEAEKLLSPLHRNILSAFLLFLKKRIKIDILKGE